MREVVLWCGQSMSDLEMGKIAFTAEKWSYSCFFAQQSSEKALRSLYYFFDIDFERRHGLSELYKGLPREAMDALGFLREDLVIMDQYYLPTRYPDALGTGNYPFESYTRRQADESLAKSGEVLEIVLSLVKMTNPEQKEIDQGSILEKIGREAAQMARLKNELYKDLLNQKKTSGT